MSTRTAEIERQLAELGIDASTPRPGEPATAATRLSALRGAIAMGKQRGTDCSEMEAEAEELREVIREYGRSRDAWQLAERLRAELVSIEAERKGKARRADGLRAELAAIEARATELREELVTLAAGDDEE